jgi:hypothetical protein
MDAREGGAVRRGGAAVRPDADVLGPIVVGAVVGGGGDDDRTRRRSLREGSGARRGGDVSRRAAPDPGGNPSATRTWTANAARPTTTTAEKDAAVVARGAMIAGASSGGRDRKSALCARGSDVGNRGPNFRGRGGGGGGGRGGGCTNGIIYGSVATLKHANVVLRHKFATLNTRKCVLRHKLNTKLMSYGFHGENGNGNWFPLRKMETETGSRFHFPRLKVCVIIVSTGEMETKTGFRCGK